jgi:hypothetical protein
VGAETGLAYVRYVKYLGFLVAACLVGLAVVAALLASDVHAWQRTLESDDAVAKVSTPSTHLSSSFSERLLGVRDDRDVREGLGLYRRHALEAEDLTNAINQAIHRSRTEGVLEGIVRSGGPPNRMSQISTLVGILAYGDFARGNQDPSQTSAATSDLQQAVALDPTNEDAKYDLELVLRIFSRRGVGTSFSNTSRPGAQGHRGAGGGAPGSGY